MTEAESNAGRECQSESISLIPGTTTGTVDESSRILLADDSDTFRETLAFALRKFGYECACAPDSAKALELLRGSDFDLLLSDLAMPGNEDLAFIRETAKAVPGLPVILLTGFPTMESAAQSVRLPVVAYLVKPVKLDELQELMPPAIERYRRFRLVRAHRQRLQVWLNDLAGIEELLARTADPAAAVPADDVLALTFENMVASLADLKQMIHALSRQDGKQEAIANVALVEALRNATEVLAESRQSFKSKELGDLRRQLEGLLRTGGG